MCRLLELVDSVIGNNRREEISYKVEIKVRVQELFSGIKRILKQTFRKSEIEGYNSESIYRLPDGGCCKCLQSRI